MSIDNKKLIEEIKKQDILYKPSEQEDKQAKEAAWATISESLGIPAPELQTRWEELLEELKKKMSTSDGEPPKKSQKLDNEEEMSFVKPYIRVQELEEGELPEEPGEEEGREETKMTKQEDDNTETKMPKEEKDNGETKVTKQEDDNTDTKMPKEEKDNGETKVTKKDDDRADAKTTKEEGPADTCKI